MYDNCRHSSAHGQLKYRPRQTAHALRRCAVCCGCWSIPSMRNQLSGSLRMRRRPPQARVVVQPACGCRITVARSLGRTRSYACLVLLRFLSFISTKVDVSLVKLWQAGPGPGWYMMLSVSLLIGFTFHMRYPANMKCKLCCHNACFLVFCLFVLI